MSHPAILIVSEQPVVAALLAMLVELAGYRPELAWDGDRLEDLLQRAPTARVALLDERHSAARSDLFHARAQRRGVAVVFFGALARRSAAAPTVAARGARWLSLPAEAAEVARLLEGVRAPASGERRRPRVERVSDGSMIYLDRAGERWHVYDRRVGADRRREERGGTQRIFLNAEGEMWRYRLAHADEEESGREAPDVLERQLARAERVCVEE